MPEERFARSRHCLSVAVPAGGLLRSGEAGLESAAMQPERRTAARKTIHQELFRHVQTSWGL